MIIESVAGMVFIVAILAAASHLERWLQQQAHQAQDERPAPPAAPQPPKQRSKPHVRSDPPGQPVDRLH